MSSRALHRIMPLDAEKRELAHAEKRRGSPLSFFYSTFADGLQKVSSVSPFS